MQEPLPGALVPVEAGDPGPETVSDRVSVITDAWLRVQRDTGRSSELTRQEREIIHLLAEHATESSGGQISDHIYRTRLRRLDPYLQVFCPDVKVPEEPQNTAAPGE